MNLCASFRESEWSEKSGASALAVTVLHFDGLCEPCNPGGWCCAGWVLIHPDGSKTLGNSILSPPGPESTNNAAESGAMIAGIEAARAAGAIRLEIRGDSQLVINQLTGRFRVQCPRMQVLRVRAQAALGAIEWRARWIPRDLNAEADAQSRLAYRAVKNGGVRTDRSESEEGR